MAHDISKKIGAQLRIVSAGMGLLHPETAIPPYSLTLSLETRDCILRRAARDRAFTSEEWWKEIRSEVHGAKPFERLLSTYPRGLLVVALTRPYLEMIASELAILSEANRSRIRIVGPTRAQTLPEELRACMMPYDARLNDVNGHLRGTAFDFPSRALVHFTDLVKLDKRIGDAKSHAQRVRRSLAHWTAPELSPGQRIDNITLRKKIRTLKSSNFSRTAGLRHLRRELGLACEQRRFMAAWGQA